MRTLILTLCIFIAGCSGGGQTDVKARAHEEGHKAGKLGQPVFANPYSSETWSHEGWMKGWAKGDEERIEEEKKQKKN